MQDETGIYPKIYWFNVYKYSAHACVGQIIKLGRPLPISNLCKVGQVRRLRPTLRLNRTLVNIIIYFLYCYCLRVSRSGAVRDEAYTFDDFCVIGELFDTYPA